MAKFSKQDSFYKRIRHTQPGYSGTLGAPSPKPPSQAQPRRVTTEGVNQQIRSAPSGTQSMTPKNPGKGAVAPGRGGPTKGKGASSGKPR